MIFSNEHITIPELLGNKLIELSHENHPGIVRTKQQLRERYWWPCLDKQVENAVHNCHICQAADKSAKLVVAPLQSVSFLEKGCKKLGMDMVGPLPHAPPHCRFEITLVDYYSKGPEVCFACAVACDAVMTSLTAVFSQYGFTQFMVMDSGTQFKSKQF